MYKIIKLIIAPLANFRQKEISTFTKTQIDHVKYTCAGDVPTIQITK